MRLTITEVTSVLSLVSAIILGWLFLDSRHDPAGASAKSKLEAYIYSLDLQIADLTSTISRYNLLEERGELSDGDRFRRAELIRLREEYGKDKRDYQEELNSL